MSEVTHHRTQKHDAHNSTHKWSFMNRTFFLLFSLISISASAFEHEFWPYRTFSQTNNDITVNVRPVPQQETATLFKGYGRRLLGRQSPVVVFYEDMTGDKLVSRSAAIFPLEITVTNNKERPVLLDKSLISLPTLNNDQIIARCTRNIAKTIFFAGVGFTAGAFIGAALPFAGLALIAMNAPTNSALSFVIPYGVVAASIFLSPIGGSIGTLIGQQISLKPSTALVNEITVNVAPNQILIPAQATVRDLIFVRAKEFSNTFSMVLETGNEIVPFIVRV